MSREKETSNGIKIGTWKKKEKKNNRRNKRCLLTCHCLDRPPSA
jgi:hypothetical protein